MSNVFFSLLPQRGVLAIQGPDRKSFFQGLITNDMEKLKKGQALYAALLTPQGRFLHDMMVVESEETIFIDCEFSRRDDLQKRLQMYKLRSRIDIKDATESWVIMAIWGGEFSGVSIGQGCLIFPDPRLPVLGWRLLGPRSSSFPSVQNILKGQKLKAAQPEDYDLWRLKHGIPEGSLDLEPGKALPLEYGFDRLNAISWDKGCYIGQEVTARTKHKGVIRKGLFPVLVEGVLPLPGTSVVSGGEEMGEVRSGYKNRALALLRLEAVEKKMPLTVGEAHLSVQNLIEGK